MDTTSKFLELKDMYDSLAVRYEELTDTNIEESFSLMINSSSLQASMEELSVALIRDITLEETKIKSMWSKISMTEKSVAAGDRKASGDESIQSEQKRLAESVYWSDLVKVMIKHLQRIYFDSKLVYENACRQTREPIGDEKLVGRY